MYHNNKLINSDAKWEENQTSITTSYSLRLLYYAELFNGTLFLKKETGSELIKAKELLSRLNYSNETMALQLIEEVLQMLNSCAWIRYISDKQFQLFTNTRNTINQKVCFVETAISSHYTKPVLVASKKSYKAEGPYFKKSKPTPVNNTRNDKPRFSLFWNNSIGNNLATD